MNAKSMGSGVAEEAESVESFLTVAEHPEGLPLGHILAHHAARDPNHPAVTIDGVTTSRAELDARSNRRARALAGMGVGQDDFVTLALPNGLEFYETAFAIWKLGATVNPVSWRLPDAELRAIVETAKPKLVVGVDPARLPDHMVIPPGFEPDPSLSDAPLLPKVAQYWRAMTSGGSTGRPKVIVDHMAARWDPAMTFAMQALGDTVLNPGPLYHNGPFMYAMKGLFAGAHIVEGGKFDALNTLRLIQTHKVNWVMLVPTMMSRIWAAACRTAQPIRPLKPARHVPHRRPLSGLAEGQLDRMAGPRPDLGRLMAAPRRRAAASSAGARRLSIQGRSASRFPALR